ncbi:MAG: DEAD/DEAH box helicase family protein [Bacteroidetes bacterium]|nr:DEAD/DEAH box helicase family protein [Bacteroidota bacterium]
MLSQKLVLFHFLLKQFGFDVFEDLRRKYNDRELEAGKAGNSIFYQNLVDKCLIPIDDLKRYDDNIISYLEQVNQIRTPKINLKYFQYFSLLFTELYLDQYFDDKQELCKRLNLFKTEFCERNRIRRFPYFEPDELNMIGYWKATGSGKTLIMHFNILQYQNYCNDINHLIVLTPSEYMSSQHLDELHKSGIPAVLYLDDKSCDKVKVIDIHKIREFKKGTGVTIGVDEFDQKNALFVDEGHKGSSSDESVWRDLRGKMGLNGFTFEYSATFGQITNTYQPIYAKGIVFDYSYKHFYKDGYGKDYWIHNLRENHVFQNDDEKREYLLLNLLVFAQQKAYYNENIQGLQEYQLENPMLIFVGHTVNPKAAKDSAEEEENKQTISDVKILMEFFQDLLTDRAKYINWINSFISGNSAFSSDYRKKLDWLKTKSKTPSQLYNKLLYEVFNVKSADKLELHPLRNADGEIALKVQNADHHFGLINIGDVSSFKTALKDSFTFKTDAINESLFHSLDDETDKPINILIGARKFIEGWNNFRVSGIGLINFGKSEGAQIIQLFGRGVRLKGKEDSLKRTKASTGLNNIQIVETLNVFGLNANYMSQFRNDLEREGIKTQKEKIILKPKLYERNGKKINDLKLKTLVPKKTLPAFYTHDVFTLENDDKIKVLVDLSFSLYTYESSTQGDGIQPVSIPRDIKPLFPLLNYGDLYLNLLAYKNKKRYFNLVIAPDSIPELLESIRIEVKSIEEIKIENYDDIEKFQKLVLTLLKNYMDKYYNSRLRQYESKNMVSKFMSEDHPLLKNLEYELEIDTTDDEGKLIADIEATIEKINEALVNEDYPINLKDDNEILLNAWFDYHLFQPLPEDAELQQKKGIKEISVVRPKGLNDGEIRFVEHLQSHLKAAESNNTYNGLSFYLLRNANRGKGLGFYFSASGGFFPDFLFWIKKGRKQYLTFIDPHGMRNEDSGFDSDRIQLHKNIKEIKASGVILNSFILCPSTFIDTGMSRWQRPEQEQNDLKEYANSVNVFECVGNDSSYIKNIINNIVFV